MLVEPRHDLDEVARAIAIVELVGPLPADIQLYTSFAGANSTTTKQPDAGKAFFKFLVTPDTAKVMRAKGLEPAS